MPFDQLALQTFGTSSRCERLLHTAVECSEYLWIISPCLLDMRSLEIYPRLCGVKVNALDSLGPSKELPLEDRIEMSHFVQQCKGV